jgi:hypothetical protein
MARKPNVTAALKLDVWVLRNRPMTKIKREAET